MVVVSKGEMDRHTMQSEIGYLLNGLWKERGKEKEQGECRERDRERRGERERENGETEREGIDGSCLLRGRWKRGRLRLQAGSKICLPWQTEKGVGMACLLKGQNRLLQVRYVPDYGIYA